jgi:hypothetical protein
MSHPLFQRKRRKLSNIDNNIISLCSAPDNNIFVGTERGGLCIISPEGKVIKIYKP